MAVEPGLSAEVELTVSEEDTAEALRTGAVPVLATPRIVALAEEAAVKAVTGRVGEDDTTVAMQVQLDHLAPTPIGGTVTAAATVDKVNGRRITFNVCVNDERGVVAVGRVTRVVVNTERFLDKATG